jgi:hypothetical protein
MWVMRDSNVANPAKESVQVEFPHGLDDVNTFAHKPPAMATSAMPSVVLMVLSLPDEHGNVALGAADGAQSPRSTRDRNDEKLLEALRANLEGTIRDHAVKIGKSRSATVTALGRLRDAGLANRSG